MYLDLWRRKRILPNTLILSSLIGLVGAFPGIAQTRSQDLEEIGQLRETAVEALNTRDFSRVEPFLHPEFTITTVDNRIFKSVQDFEEYWDQQLSGPIDRIEMTVEPDGSTIFLSDQTGVNYGLADSTFYFSNGVEREMLMRWSSVVQKEDDEWLLQSLHFSANLLDNPVLRATQQLGLMISLCAGAGGLIIGVLVTLLFGRLRDRT